METPIHDFTAEYASSSPLRLHMPGHKGNCIVGPESVDITEISGADSLYEACGIIKESEENAGSLFGCHTFYSAEGSSLSIRAMLYLACLYAKEKGEKPLIFAGRNCHKSFIYAAAMLDFDVRWLYPKNAASYLSCDITASELQEALITAPKLPTAVYITSPDYLGNTVNISEIAEVCRRHGVLLLVDNAHGAYLKFLPKSLHPIDCGATACCDSAHKTLPVLTGGGYLHISKNAPQIFADAAKNALALFGSTSPSYLILQSLDMANKYIADGYRERLSETVLQIDKLKSLLRNHGYTLAGDEPLKVTVCAKKYGYTGEALAKLLLEKNIVCEFSDPDFLVMMLTPEISKKAIEALYNALAEIPKKDEIKKAPPEYTIPTAAMSIREAVLSPSETLPAEQCLGKILALPNCACPPAVQIVACGEIIDGNALNCFEYYGISECRVVIKP